MKISASDLEKKIKPFSKDEVTLHTGEGDNPSRIYSNITLEFPEKCGWGFATTLKDAIKRRASGEKVLSHREADVLCRKNTHPDSCGLMIPGMGLYIEEGIVGLDGNVWEVRAFYNRGVQFKKSGKYDESSVDKQNIADAKMAELLDCLAELQLWAWTYEMEDGFPVELTKPEYMTFDQYNKARKQRKFLNDAV